MPKDRKRYNPLKKPMLFYNWQRRVASKVIYKSPCGHEFRNMKNLYEFLVSTQSPLNVENFSFDLLVNCMGKNKKILRTNVSK